MRERPVSPWLLAFEPIMLSFPVSSRGYSGLGLSGPTTDFMVGSLTQDRKVSSFWGTGSVTCIFETILVLSERSISSFYWLYFKLVLVGECSGLAGQLVGYVASLVLPLGGEMGENGRFWGDVKVGEGVL